MDRASRSDHSVLSVRGPGGGLHEYQALSSVLQDEGWDGLYLPPPTNNPLVHNLAARRWELAKPQSSSTSSCLARETEGGWRLAGRYDFGTLADPDPVIEKDEGGVTGVFTYQEVFGHEFVARLEALLGATGAEDRAAARDELDTFLVDVGARPPAHRRDEDPPGPALREMFTQLRHLLELLWMPLGEVGTAERARAILDAHKVSEADRHQWCLRLAVPALSWPELQAVMDQQEQAASWGKLMQLPTARRLAVWILARRLGSPPARIANKVGAGSDWDYFNEATNPVDPFAPGRVSDPRVGSGGSFDLTDVTPAPRSLERIRPTCVTAG